MVFLLSYLGGERGEVQRVSLELDLTRVVAFSSKGKEGRRAREMRIQDLLSPEFQNSSVTALVEYLQALIQAICGLFQKQNVMLFHSEKFSCIFFSYLSPTLCYHFLKFLLVGCQTSYFLIFSHVSPCLTCFLRNFLKISFQLFY